MAYNNYYGNNSYGGNRGGYGNNRQNNGGRNFNQAPLTVPEEKYLDPKSDYVGLAEKTLSALYENRNDRITTSKLRNILSMATDVYNIETRRTDAELLDSSKRSLQLMRIRLLYECGREKTVKKFVETTGLISYLKGIKTREDFIAYSHYLEALVAYHRYFGGGEN